MLQNGRFSCIQLEMTGCSFGIGLAVAVLLAKDKLKRFKVVATMRDLDKREALEIAAGETLNRSLEIRQLDATCEDSIRECVNSLPDRRADVLGDIESFLSNKYFLHSLHLSS